MKAYGGRFATTENQVDEFFKGKKDSDSTTTEKTEAAAKCTDVLDACITGANLEQVDDDALLLPATFQLLPAAPLNPMPKMPAMPTFP